MRDDVMHSQNGIGLPELLVSLLLSSCIMMGLMHHYLATKKQYNHVQKEVEANIDMQLVTDLIRDSIRRAGFTPCLSIEHLIRVDQRNKPQKLLAIEVDGNKPGLRINRMSEYFDTLVQIISSNQLLVTNTRQLHRGQSILIADCYHAEIQTINRVTITVKGQIITLIKPLMFTYQEPVYIGQWIEEAYFIHPTKSGNASLFYQHHHAEELTTAVKKIDIHLKKHQAHTTLQVIFGLDKARTFEFETMVRA